MGSAPGPPRSGYAWEGRLRRRLVMSGAGPSYSRRAGSRPQTPTPGGARPLLELAGVGGCSFGRAVAGVAFPPSPGRGDDLGHRAAPTTATATGITVRPQPSPRRHPPPTTATGGVPRRGVGVWGRDPGTARVGTVPPPTSTLAGAAVLLMRTRSSGVRGRSPWSAASLAQAGATPARPTDASTHRRKPTQATTKSTERPVRAEIASHVAETVIAAAWRQFDGV